MRPVKKRRAPILWLAMLLTAGEIVPLRAAPAPSESAELIRTATSEGVLRIYTNTHRNVATDLLRAFGKVYPQIRVEYTELNATPLYDRFLDEVAKHKPTADFVWSSAMDMQVKLINDGYALTYASPERDALPSWALWLDQGYGITSEPVVFVYNKNLVTPSQVPHTHAEFAELLRAHSAEFHGKVATYDPMGSEVGMFFLSQDVHVTRDTWDLVRAFGATKPVLYSNAGDVIQHVAQGDQAIGYNVMGSYALEWQKHDGRIGVVFPDDYTLLLSRIAFIPAVAEHPSAAKLFLNFLLSPKAQELLSQHSMLPIRRDVPVPADEPRLRPFQIQAIQINASLLANLDRLVRIRFERDWLRALGGPIPTISHPTAQ